MYQCCVPNVTITTSPEGIVDAFVLIKFSLNSEHNIHMCIKIPIVLVRDGYGIQKSQYIVGKAVELKIIIFLLPENETHLIQTLCISVFKSLKCILKRCV